MNYTMARVQVYLNPQDVSLVDTIAEKINIKRSQVIRDAINAIALRYVQVAQFLTVKKPLKNPLLELGGMEVSKTGRASINVDEIYSQT
ncbi:ribbon-helix-helix domain-containing protein [Patescibacteria group bacterium]|nr:ribbon-helix-helix domain-containing protein [Patescibacteria group bacterium]